MRALLLALALFTVSASIVCADDGPQLYYLGPEIGIVPIVWTPVGPVIALNGQPASQVLPGFACPCGLFPNYAKPSQFTPYTPIGQLPALPPNLWHPGDPLPAGNGPGPQAAPTAPEQGERIAGQSPHQ